MLWSTPGRLTLGRLSVSRTAAGFFMEPAVPVYAHILCTLYSANGEVCITRYGDRSDQTIFFSVTVRDERGSISYHVCADSLERAVDRLLEQSQSYNHRAIVIIESCLYEYEWLRQLELLEAAG